MSKTGLSRGSIADQRFIENAANNYVVEAFVDVSAVAPGSGLLAATDEQQYLVDAGSGSELVGWGTITGLVDKAIIKYNSTLAQWQMVFTPAAAEQGATLYDKDSDTIYSFDGADWNIASGAGGGVKNFASAMASGYKVGDWTKGNNATFGTAGTFAGSLDIETTAPLDGKKSFKYTAAAGSQNDWMYFLVDISEYARGGVMAFTFDYTWDGAEDVNVKIFDPTLTNEYTTELNLLKNTTNDNKKSRNSRTIYAHPDTEAQVIVGFQITGVVAGGEELIFDNLKVTDDIGVIGGTNELPIKESIRGRTTIGDNAFTTQVNSITDGSIEKLGTFATSGNFTYTAAEDQYVNLTIGGNSSTTAANTTLRINIRINGVIVAENDTSGYNGSNESNASYHGLLRAGQVITSTGHNYRLGGSANGRFSMMVEQKDVASSTRFLQVPNGEKLKNTFAMSMDAAGNITSQSSPNYFSHVVLSGTAGQTARCYFTTPLTSPPIPNVSLLSGVYQGAVVGVTSTNEYVQFTTWNAGVSQQLGGHVHIELSESDIAPDIVGVPVSIQGQTHEQDSMIRVSGYDGYYSTSLVRKFKDTIEAEGPAPATLLSTGEWEINSTGFYSINYTDVGVSTGFLMGISKNGNVNASPYDESPETILALASDVSGATNHKRQNCSWSGILKKGDRITPKTHIVYANPGASDEDEAKFTIAKVGTQPLLDAGQIVESSPTGSIIASASMTTPENYLYCNGAAVSRTEYKELFQAIGTTYGTGDGSTTFNLPDLRGQFLRGQDDGAGVDPDAATRTSSNGGSTGDSLGSKQGDEFKSHTHNVSIKSADDDNSTGHNDMLVDGDNYKYFKDFTSTSAGGNETRPTNVYVRYYIRYKTIFQVAPTKVYSNDPIAFQTKYLSSDVSSDGVMSDLTFNNLEIGKTYRLSGNVVHQATADDGAGTNVNNGAQAIVQTLFNPSAGGGSANTTCGISEVFTATDTTLTISGSSLSATHVIQGNGTASETHLTLEELPWHSQTSKWT